MLPYFYLSFKKKKKNIKNSKVVKTKNGRLMVSSKCVFCLSKKSSLLKTRARKWWNIK